VGRLWLKSKKDDDDDKGKKKGKDWKPVTKEEKEEAKKVRPSHQTYLVAAGGAQVQYVNCYCDNDGDHSRGTYP
jgi:hypothetical protein